MRWNDIFTCAASITAGIALATVPGLAGAQIDSPYLAGIHWYHSDPANSDVESMTGGRGIWVVDQALLDSTATVAAPNPWETPWVTSPAVNKTQPYAKPGYIQAITGKGHSAIIRLHPFWGVNVPFPGDPYTNTNFADDCKAAANLMRDVHVWQIGNEANLNGEMNRWNAATQRYDLAWPAATLLSAPELYAQTYVACRDKIHEVTPLTTPADQVVLMQPCSPGGGVAGTRYLSSDEFLARMIAAVPDKSKIDGFALHSYAEPGGPNFGASGYLNDLRRQIAIIDQAGLGNRPIFVTEFNKHMPNATEANIGAQFVTTAFNYMNAWNGQPGALWPGGGQNHPIRSAAWFVYRGGAGWDDYSLQFWKSGIASTLPAQNPWYAFQQAASQNYSAGTGSGPVFTPASTWWDDPFSGTFIDQNWPLPAWEVETPSGSSVSVSGGEAILAATSPFVLNGIRHSQVAFTDFAMEARVSFNNAAPVASGEGNMDIRIRQEGSGGPGFSLTLFSSQGTATPGQAALRKTSVWSTYRSGNVSGGINTGDQFTVQIIAKATQLEIKILRQPANTVVLDWTGAQAIPISEFRVGGIGFYTYNLREARIQNIRMGGIDSLGLSSVSDWSIYE